METVLGLLVLLAASCHGESSVCQVPEDTTCSGQAGHPLYLQLITDARGHQLELKYDDRLVFKAKGKKPVFYNEWNTPSVLKRWQYVPDNGTLIINPAERRDSGTYRVEIHNESSGASVGVYTVQLIIEAPVSDVDLSINCSANGKRSVRCSSNGDSPQFSWSLNGRNLSEADADLSPDLLRGDETGELTCSVRNHISSTHTSRRLELCIVTSTSVPVTSPNRTLSSTTAQQQDQNMVVYVSSFLVVTLVCLCVAVGMFYVWRNKRNTHTPVKEDPDDVVYVQVTTSSNAHGRKTDMQGEKGQDVVYSDVAMANRRSRRKSRKPPAAEAYELEYAEVSAFCKRGRPAQKHTPAQVVEYGEVRVHTPPRLDTHSHTPAPAQQDISVYAQVRPGQ